MRKTSVLLAAMLLIVGSATAAGAAEYAQRGDLEEFALTLTPEEGPPGTTFTVSGEDCDSGVVRVDTTDSTQTSTTPSEADANPSQDGTWSVDLTVDAGSVPYQSVVVRAFCETLQSGRDAQTFRGGRPNGFEYSPGYFEVLPDPTMTLDPTSGVAGSDFTVSGGTCSEYYDAMAEVTDGTTDKTVEPDPDGDWDTTFTVPDDAEVGDEITVMATCVTSDVVDFRGIRRGENGNPNNFDYTPVVFTVTAEPATPPAPTPTPTRKPGGAVQAEAATPTTAKPTFTG